MKIWKESGLLSREVLYYKKLIEQDKVSVNFLTFGDADDKTFIKDDLINVIPVYSKIRYSKSKLIRFFKKSLFIPLYLEMNYNTQIYLRQIKCLDRGWELSQKYISKTIDR